MDPNYQQKQFERAAAFPFLIKIAALCMLAPRGRVLGAQSRFKTFIRASPFLCLLDGIDILLRWLLTSIFLKCSLLTALKIIGHDRCRHSEPLTGIEKVRAKFLLRLLYFFAVTLPSLRKLWSFVFTPMAQIYAGMFTFSYIVDELVSAFAPPDEFFKFPKRKFASLANYASCLTSQDETRITRFRKLLQSLDILELLLGGVIVLGRVVGFFWLCFAYDCFWDMDNTGDVIRLCARKTPLIILSIASGLLFSPVADPILLRYPRVGRALDLVYPKVMGQAGEFEVDRQAKLWLVFLFVNLLSAGVGYRAFLMKVPY